MDVAYSPRRRKISESSEGHHSPFRRHAVLAMLLLAALSMLVPVIAKNLLFCDTEVYEHKPWRGMRANVDTALHDASAVAGAAAPAELFAVASEPAPKAAQAPVIVSPTPRAIPICRPGTVLHPAVDLDMSKGSTVAEGTSAGDGPEPAVAVDELQTQVLESWGLYPLPHSPVASKHVDTSDVPWRGSAVEVRSDRTVSREQPLPASAARPKRSDEDVQQRSKWLTECLHVPGARGRAINIASDDQYDRMFPQDTPGAGLTLDRIRIMQHGFTLHSAVRQYLRESYTRVSGDVSHKTGEFPTPSTPFYPGPWIEDYWLATFDRPVVRRMARAEYEPLASLQGVKLIADYVDSVEVQLPYDAELFMPWVPLFFPVNEYWSYLTAAVSNDHARAQEVCSLASILLQFMKPEEYQYITLTQRPSGPWFVPFAPSDACSVRLYQVLASTLVISAGGSGHVPIPLLGQEMPFLQCAADGSQEHSNHSLSFIGTFRNGPSRVMAARVVRYRLQPLVDAVRPTLMMTGQELVDIAGTDFGRDMLRGWGMDPAAVSPAEKALLWVRAHADASYTLAPRGSGPTSFRLYEALQMGLVPMYVHNGGPWLPYLKRGQNVTWTSGVPEEQQSLWARIAHVVDIPGLGDTLDHLFPTEAKAKAAVEARHRSMRMAAVAVRDRYFTYDGVVRRVAEFLDDPFTSELDCQGSSFV